MRRLTGDTGHWWAVCVCVCVGGGGGTYSIISVNPAIYIQPGYIAGLIYGPRGQRYNGFPLYICHYMID